MTKIVEIIRLRARPGSEDRLSEIRPRMLKDLKQKHPTFASAVLADAGDGVLVDIWVFDSLEGIEAASADGANIPSYVEWRKHVDVVGFEQLEVVDWSGAV